MAPLGNDSLRHRCRCQLGDRYASAPGSTVPHLAGS